MASSCLCVISPTAISSAGSISGSRPSTRCRYLVDPLGCAGRCSSRLGIIYGVSNKVLAMALAELLLGGDAKRPAWVEAGTVMIAIDTLVHNFLRHPVSLSRELSG
jgi:hypothetical protein